MIKQNYASGPLITLFLRSLTCFIITFCSFQLNILSKDLYHKRKIPKVTTNKVRNLIATVISGVETSSTEMPVYVETPHKDCAVTIKVTDNLSMIPKPVAEQVSRVLRYLNTTNGIMRLHYEGNKLKFLGILENKKYKKVAIKYGKGWFTQQGIQLDKKYSIPAFTSLIKAKDDSKKVRISDGYGYRLHPIHKKRIFHPGVDIAGPSGSRVFAALPGKVKKIGYSRSYGTYLLLQHQGNLETKYAHLHSVERRMVPGREVKQGTLIGFVGQTGSATGPHLHFEVRMGNKHINPAAVKPFALQLEGADLTKLKNVYSVYSKQLRTRYPIQLNLEQLVVEEKVIQPVEEKKEMPQVKGTIKPLKSKVRSLTPKAVTKKLIGGMTKLSTL
jgi:murein DD-endopeptidase MepM/ murein hydrolase activator NlpD